MTSTRSLTRDFFFAKKSSIWVITIELSLTFKYGLCFDFYCSSRTYAPIGNILNWWYVGNTHWISREKCVFIWTRFWSLFILAKLIAVSRRESIYATKVYANVAKSRCTLFLSLATNLWFALEFSIISLTNHLQFLANLTLIKMFAKS